MSAVGERPLSGELCFGPALPEDEPQLRRVLRDNPMAGAVSVAFAREPDFALAAGLEGPIHEVIVAREPGGRVVGLCSRSARPAWINGEPRWLGYLSALRLDPAWRGRRRVLQRGFEAVRALHEADGRTPFYMTTIIEDNAPARRFLGANLPGMPRYTEREVICTLALPTWRARPGPRGVAVRQATDADLGGIAACLARSGQRHQLAPVWTEADLRDPARARGLRPEDFTVAERGGQVVGCVALWDQGAFKQSIVAAYGGALGRFRGLVNAAAPLLNVPRLPPAGQPLRHAFLSHLAAEDADLELVLALTAAAHTRALGRGYAYLMLGLAERHPWKVPVQRHFGAMEYRAVLYLVSWPDGHAAADAVDGRTPHLEVAVL